MILASMPFDRWFKISLYLLALDAVAGLLATSILTPPGFGVVAVFVLLAGWADSRRLRIPRQLAPLIPGGFLLFLLLDSFLLGSSLQVAITHLFVLFLTYKLLDLRTHRDILWIYLFTFVLLFVAATKTTSLAFLGIFVGYLALGTWSWILFHLKRETETALPGEGSALLARTRLVTPRFMASSLGLAFGCFLMTLGLFFLIPRVGLITSFGPPVARTSGYAERTTLEASGSIEVDPTVVMRVAFPHGLPHPEQLATLRWRGTSVDTFDGKAWFQSSLRRPLVDRDGREFTVAHPTPGQPVLVQEIFLEPIGGRQLFAAPTLVRLRGPFSGLHVDSGDGIVVSTEIEQPLRYVAFSQLDPLRPERLRAAETLVPPGIGERYLTLPEVSPRVAALAREIVGAAPTPYDAALLLERYLTTQFVYRLGVTLRPGADPLEDFLFTQRQGHCEYFAASMAVLLRILGIPSRVVTGFQKGEWNNVGRFYTVRQRDAHSWVEAYFPGSGWVSFDPSPRGEFERRAFSPGGWITKAVEALRLRWTRSIIRYTAGDQIAMAASLHHQLQESGSALAQAWKRLASGTPGALRELGGFVALGVAGLGLISLLLLRRKRGSARPESPVVFYERVLRLLARRGFLRPAASTAREFARSLARHPAHGPVAEITGLYERVRFGRERLSQADERRALDLMDEVKGLLKEAEKAKLGGGSRARARGSA